MDESDEAQSDFSEVVFIGSAVLGMKPSCSHFRQDDSKSVGAPASPGVPGAAAALGWVFGRFAGVSPAVGETAWVLVDALVELWTRSLPLAVR